MMPAVLTAQKAFKPIKTALKDKDYKGALAKIQNLRSDSLYSDNAKLCRYSIDAYRGLNDAENVKIYLRQSYDTLGFFSTTRNIILEALRMDSVERLKSSTYKQSSYVASLLQLYYPNLVAAGRYYFTQGRWKESMDYLQICLNIPLSPIGLRAGIPTEGDPSNAARYTISAFKLKDYTSVTRYDSLALQDSAYRPAVLKSLALTALAQGDSLKYKDYLVQGWQENTSYVSFFTRLADYYLTHGQPKEALRIAEVQLKRDSADLSAQYARCMAYLSLQRFDDCISTAQLLLVKDTVNAEANYYIGLAYMAKAFYQQLPSNVFSTAYKKAKQERNRFLRNASIYLEAYRQKAPEKSHKWAPLLYKIYFELNDGEKFAEMETILKKEKIATP